MKQLPEELKEQIKEVLYELYKVDMFNLRDEILFNGFVGFNKMTDEQLIEEMKMGLCDEDEENLKLLAAAKKCLS